MTALIDQYSRQFSYLRLSVIDLCNFRCSYCLPNGNTGKKKNYLNLNEIERLLRAFAQLGISKVRITGGEPSLRNDFLDIISMASSIEGIHKVVCTTNGYKLSKQANDLVRAGIKGLNVSVDSLNPVLFHKITGHDKLSSVLAGIQQAQAVGIPVKINAVLLKSFNANELDSYLSWIKHQDITVRYIELMQTADNTIYFGQNHLSAKQIYNKLLEEGWKIISRAKDDGPAITFSHENYLGKIGLIMPYAKDFCQTCNRLRVSSVGDIHLCLFGDSTSSLREYLQYDYQLAELKKIIQERLQLKKSTHFLHEGNYGITQHLATIGG